MPRTDHKAIKLSVCIPTYEMHGQGHLFLKDSFDILKGQSFRDFEVIISDHSKDDLIKNLCEEYQNKLSITYVRKTDQRGNLSANTNNAIRHARGRLIKILFQDDFLYDTDSLAKTVNAFDLNRDSWLISSSEHSNDGKTFFRPFYPVYNNKIYTGKNTISSPSVLTIKNSNPLLFDEEVVLLMDCDYYKRCYDHFGSPKILNDITVVNRVGQHQTSKNTTNESAKKEIRYMRHKFETPNNLWLKDVSLVAATGIDPAGCAKALEISMDKIDFGEVLLISHRKPLHLDERITFRECKPTELDITDKKNTNAWSKFMLYDLDKYVNNKHALIVHNDAFVVRSYKWSDVFLKYDYIGAPWPRDIHFTKEKINIRVGNGGFSLRSKRLLGIFNDLNLPFIDNGTGFFHDDGIICGYHRKTLEDHGIKYAPVELAADFSLEKLCDDSNLQPFGFHNNKAAIPIFFLTKFHIKRFFRIYSGKSLTALSLLKNRPKSFIRLIKEKTRRYFGKKSRVIENIDKNYIKRLIGKSDATIFEIGCANGDDTLDFLGLFDSTDFRLYGFEPEPKNIKILHERITDPRFSLFEGALSDSSGMVTFNRSSTSNADDLSLSGSIVKPKNHTKIWTNINFDQTMTVRSTSLDDFCKEKKIEAIDFIWCDAQGAEGQIIKGGTRTLATKVRYLYMEYSNNELYAGQPSLKKILKLLPSFEIVHDYGNDILLRNKRMHAKI